MSIVSSNSNKSDLFPIIYVKWDLVYDGRKTKTFWTINGICNNHSGGSNGNDVTHKEFLKEEVITINAYFIGVHDDNSNWSHILINHPKIGPMYSTIKTEMYLTEAEYNFNKRLDEVLK